MSPRHCERSEAIHSQRDGAHGLLRRFAPRNDGLRIGCLKIESISSSRTSERSERDPGPITTDVCVAQDWSYNPIDNSDRWLWVPRSRAQLRTRRGRHRDITHLRDPLTRNDDLEMPHTYSRHRPRRRAIQYSRGVSDGIERPRRTGYPAFAGYDGSKMVSSRHSSSFTPSRDPLA